jgi:glyceraldehyde-3-phosphate dehydrogenase (NADP+)
MLSFEPILKNQNYICGIWHPEGSGSTLTVVDKYSQNPITQVPLASADQMELAIAGAVQCSETLKSWSAGKRAEHLRRLRDLLSKHVDEFTTLIVAEAGKPIDYAKNEVQRAITTLDIAAAEAMRIGGEVVPIDFGIGENRTAFTRRYPIGPIACISPFNFPLNLAMHKIAPALAVGCGVVLKPAPQAPLSCLAFAGLVEAAGYPAGAVNILVCDIPVAEKMVTDQRIKMLSFTGSPQVGWHLKNICGRKKVTLELGGNAAVIVDSSADLPYAARLTARGAFLYAGQICISTQRIYVCQPVFNQFVNLLIEETNRIVSGDPSNPEVINGPIIDKHHFERIHHWVTEAKNAGAHVLTGGVAIAPDQHIYAPTLLTKTRSHMKVVCEEVFGPVAIVEPVPDFVDALDKTNDSEFGLQAGVFTQRIDQMKLAHESLEVGAVIINNIPGFRIDNMPYGGVKASGLGREGLKYAIEEMTEPRLLVY